MTTKTLAYRRLRHTIFSGGVKPSERLSHRKLAAQMGVGLRPMREAMLRLDAEGLLEHVPRSGTHLRKPSPEEAINLSDLRELIEPYAAARAARFAKPQEASRLQQICERMAKLTSTLIGGGTPAWLSGPGVRSRVLDLQFHRTILGASRNPSALMAFDRIGVLPLLFLNHPDVMQDLTRDLHQADADHQDIADAIASGDARAARHCMETHLLHARFATIAFSVLPTHTADVADGEEIASRDSINDLST